MAVFEIHTGKNQEVVQNFIAGQFYLGIFPVVDDLHAIHHTARHGGDILIQEGIVFPWIRQIQAIICCNNAMCFCAKTGSIQEVIRNFALLQLNMTFCAILLDLLLTLVQCEIEREEGQMILDVSAEQVDFFCVSKDREGTQN